MGKGGRDNLLRPMEGLGDFGGQLRTQRLWGVNDPLTFGVAVLEGDCPLVLGSEASATGEAQGPACFRLVGAAWARLAGLKAIS